VTGALAAREACLTLPVALNARPVPLFAEEANVIRTKHAGTSPPPRTHPCSEMSGMNHQPFAALLPCFSWPSTTNHLLCCVRWVARQASSQRQVGSERCERCHDERCIAAAASEVTTVGSWARGLATHTATRLSGGGRGGKPNDTRLHHDRARSLRAAGYDEVHPGEHREIRPPRQARAELGDLHRPAGTHDRRRTTRGDREREKPREPADPGPDPRLLCSRRKAETGLAKGNIRDFLAP
jgi:hypothetical protein